MATDPRRDDLPLALKPDEGPQAKPRSAPASQRAKVWFVGAGPGDPDLLTVKGRRLLETADTVFYSGSLTAEGWLSLAKPGADWKSTARLSLAQFMPVMVEAARAGRQVVRLASGDPAVFGALGALTEWLRREEIEYEVVPGVSSFLAAAAALGGELTIPEVAQSVIITRTAGRMPMPEGEQLADLARHGTTIVVFLSSPGIRMLVEDLRTAYPPETPVAVVDRATRPEQKIVRGTLETIAELVLSAGVSTTSILIVGNVLAPESARARATGETTTEKGAPTYQWHGNAEPGDDS